MFVIGILSVLLASIALLLSIYSMFQLHKLGKLNKDFLRTQGIKTLSLYAFWVLLLADGILLSQENEAGIPIFLAALMIVMIHLTVKMLVGLFAYIQFSQVEKKVE